MIDRQHDRIVIECANMSNVVRLKRKPRPLRKTYSTTSPYVVERQDQDDGSITYEIFDERPESYRFVCGVSDDCGGNPYAKHDAEQISRGLNLLVQYGKETLPAVRDRD
jgi:hypothetical protein